MYCVSEWLFWHLRVILRNPIFLKMAQCMSWPVELVNNIPIVSFTHPSTHSLTLLPTHMLAHSLACSFTCLLIHLLAHSLACSLTCLLIHLLTRPTHLHTRSLTHSLTHSLVHPLTHSLTHTLTHALTHLHTLTHPPTSLAHTLTHLVTGVECLSYSHSSTAPETTLTERKRQVSECVSGWMSEWVCEHKCVSGWTSECVSECVSERVCKWVDESVRELSVWVSSVCKWVGRVSKWMSKQVNEQASEWASKWMSKQVNEQASEWASMWVGRRVSECVDGWVKETIGMLFTNSTGQLTALCHFRKIGFLRLTLRCQKSHSLTLSLQSRRLCCATQISDSAPKINGGTCMNYIVYCLILRSSLPSEWVATNGAYRPCSTSYSRVWFSHCTTNGLLCSRGWCKWWQSLMIQYFTILCAIECKHVNMMLSSELSW